MTTQKQWERWFLQKTAGGVIDQREDDDTDGRRAANPLAKVLICKTLPPITKRRHFRHVTAERGHLFNDVMLRKAAVSDPLRGPRDENDDAKVETKLRAWAKLMVTVDPTRSEAEHLHRMTSTAHGRSLALHLNEISKKEQPMPQVDIRKLIPLLEEGLMAQATINKRDGETDAKAFARKYENDLDFRKSWATVTEAKQRLALSMPNIMSVEPVFTEVGNTNSEDDSAKAIKQLNDLAEKQHRTFEEVFLDDSNKELANRTYRTQQRPMASSTSGDELQRR